MPGPETRRGGLVPDPGRCRPGAVGDPLGRVGQPLHRRLGRRAGRGCGSPVGGLAPPRHLLGGRRQPRGLHADLPQRPLLHDPCRRAGLGRGPLRQAPAPPQRLLGGRRESPCRGPCGPADNAGDGPGLHPATALVDAGHGLAQRGEGGNRLALERGEPRPSDLGLEVADVVPMRLLGLGVAGAELLLALLQPVDRRLALVGVALRDRAVEDQPAHAALVPGGVPGLGRARLAAQCCVERPHAVADPGVAEVDAGRVVAQVGAHPGRGGFEPGERAQARHLALGVDEEGVVVGDDAALGRDLVEHGGVVALPQVPGRASRSSGCGA